MSDASRVRLLKASILVASNIHSTGNSQSTRIHIMETTPRQTKA